MGVVGIGVLGQGVELDSGEGAISMIVGKLPRETEIRPFTMSRESIPVWSLLFESQPQTTAATDENSVPRLGLRPGFFIFCDPYELVNEALRCLSQAWPT